MKRVMKIAIAILGCVICGALFGWMATVIINNGDGMLGALMLFGAPDPLETIKAYPIDYANPDVALAALVGFFFPMIVGFMMRVRGQKVNEDSDSAHGNARLATDKEMSDLMDAKNPCNNIRYTEHSGIVLKAHDKKTKAAQYARNFNCITIGISGLGKTFNIVTPDIMAATGNALRPYPYGVSALLTRIKEARSHKLIMNDEATGGKRRLTRSALAAGVGDGFDLFTTDPKGDTLRDMGNMLVEAGFDIRVFNTLDSGYDKFNPLAYIPYSEVDAKDPSEITITASRSYDGKDMGNITHVLGSGADESSHAGTIRAVITSTVETKNVDVNCVEDKHVNSDEIEDVTFETKTFTQTNGTIAILLQNRTDDRHTVSMTIKLDETLRIKDPQYGDADSTVIKQGKNLLTITMTDAVTIELSAELLPTRDRDSRIEIELPYTIRTNTIPDGIGLTKIVDVLTANLGTKPADGKAGQDPFWEDTKKLCFQSLIAFLFEKYPESERTLPCMMDLLDVALPDSGNPEDISPLYLLINEWEKAERLEPVVEGADTSSNAWGVTEKGRWVTTHGIKHSRSTSLAVHCYHAFTQAAKDTVLSVIISCQAALAALSSLEVREMLSKDELHLDRLGEPGQKSAIFCVTSDVDSPFDFLTALIVQIALNSAQDRAYAEHNGKLPRHVRLILDEAANIGKIPVLVRASAVVRSRNISISMFVQSKAQLALVYGEKQADIILDNCSTWLFLGAQTPETLNMIADKIGDETVWTRVLNRNFTNANAIAPSTSASEQLSASGRKVRTPSQLQQMDSSKMICFIYNHLPIEDQKIKTTHHPLYRYASPGQPRSLLQPPAAFSERFDYKQYKTDREMTEERGEEDL